MSDVGFVTEDITLRTVGKYVCKPDVFQVS